MSFVIPSFVRVVAEAATDAIKQARAPLIKKFHPYASGGQERYDTFAKRMDNLETHILEEYEYGAMLAKWASCLPCSEAFHLRLIAQHWHHVYTLQVCASPDRPLSLQMYHTVLFPRLRTGGTSLSTEPLLDCVRGRLDHHDHVRTVLFQASYQWCAIL